MALPEIQFSDNIVAYHQYRALLGLPDLEAQTNSDTQEAYMNALGVVATHPELSVAYRGALICQGDRQAAAIDHVVAIERLIITGLFDSDLISRETFAKELSSLEQDSGIRARAERFMTLFDAVISEGWVPPIRIVSKKSRQGQAKPIGNDAVVILMPQKTRKTAPPKTQTRQPRLTRQQEFESAFGSNAIEEDEPDVLELDLGLLYQQGGRAAAYILDGIEATNVPLREIRYVIYALHKHEKLEDPGVKERYSHVKKLLHTENKKQSRPDGTGRENLDYDFRSEGLCVDTDSELFYPGRGENETTEAARAICNLCPVRDPCLEAALMGNEKFGVWGGLSERQRRIVRRQRKTGIDPAKERKLIARMRMGHTVEEEHAEDALDEFDELFEIDPTTLQSDPSEELFDNELTA